jgi:hypothetical protein
MSSGKCAFGKSLGTVGDKCICMFFRNSEMLPYHTVNITQYGNSLIRYAGDKQGHVTQIGIFILPNQIF